MLALVPPDLKRRPDWDDRAHPRVGDRWLRDDVLAGTVLTSPFPGVPARRWLEAAAAAVRLCGPAAMGEVLEPGGCEELEQTTGSADGFVACPLCGDWVRERGLVGHQRSSTRCRYLAAHREVVAAWHDGWRDPWSLRPHVPLVWAELSWGAWRRRVRLVDYPGWTAVLVHPRQSAQAAGRYR